MTRRKGAEVQGEKGETKRRSKKQEVRGKKLEARSKTRKMTKTEHRPSINNQTKAFTGLKKFIQYLENTSLWNCVVLIFSCIFIRIFLEGMLESSHAIGYTGFTYRAVLMYFVHFPFFYLSTFLFVIITVSLITSTRIINVIKIAGVSMVLLVFVPVIDAVIGTGYLLTYPLRLDAYFTGFLNPFFSLISIGVSPGQRIIIIGLSLFSGLYGYIKTANIFKALILAFAVLIAILFMGALTTIIAGNRPELVYINGGMLMTDTQKFSIMYGLALVLFLFLFLYLVHKKFFKLFCVSMRIERMAFYGCMGLFGFFLSSHIAGIPYRSDLFSVLGCFSIFLCLALAFWALQIYNDFFDIKADAVARSRNPLLKEISSRYYVISGICMALCALGIAAVINYTAFIIILTLFFLGAIYSAPPLRLKRIPILATFVLAIAVVLSMAFGFSTLYGGGALFAIPPNILAPTLIGITIGFISKDINDTEGDRIDGVLTIPLILQIKKSLAGKAILAVLIGLSFISYAVFIPRVLFGAVISFIIVFVYTLLIKEPREWFYFAVLYGFGAYLFFILLT